MLFYTLIMNCKKEKATVLFEIASKTKSLQINLTNEMKDLYSENYETLMKEVEDDRKKWKDICGLEELTLLKCLFYCPQAIYRFKMILINIPVAFFTELERIILKRIRNQKRSQINKAILRKK